MVVPLSIVLIGMLLYMNFRSVDRHRPGAERHPHGHRSAASFALFVRRQPFSVSAAIGFIALFGISVMDGIIVVNQFNQLVERGVERTRAILDTCAAQMRPLS